MMTDTQISYALKDKYYLLCSGEERILQRLRTRGTKGQSWEGRGVVIKGVRLTARRIVRGARTDQAWEAVWGESWALVIMNE